MHDPVGLASFSQIWIDTNRTKDSVKVKTIAESEIEVLSKRKYKPKQRMQRNFLGI